MLLLFLLFGRYPRIDAGPDLLVLLGKGSELHADVVDHVVEHFLLGTHLVSLHIELDSERVDEMLLGLNLTLIFGFEFEDAFVRLVLVSLLFG